MVWTEAPARAKVAGHPLLPIPTATASLPDSTRDLKPANVKVKADGTVKVLDFGLAKAFQPEASGAGASESPTISLTAAATQMGMVIGTAAYMAPEQASGKAVDKRADVWAFGVVLYEMLTGTRPFVGDDVSKTLAHVIAIDPDWDALPDELPPMLGSFLRGCLSKSPKQRVHDVADVRLAMEGAFDTKAGTPEDQPVAATLRVWQRPVPAVVGVLVVAVVSGLAVRGLWGYPFNRTDVGWGGGSPACWHALSEVRGRAPGLVPHRCGLLGLPGVAAVARWLRLRGLRPRQWLAAGRWTLQVLRVRRPDVGDCGHYL